MATTTKRRTGRTRGDAREDADTDVARDIVDATNMTTLASSSRRSISQQRPAVSGEIRYRRVRHSTSDVKTTTDAFCTGISSRSWQSQQGRDSTAVSNSTLSQAAFRVLPRGAAADVAAALARARGYFARAYHSEPRRDPPQTRSTPRLLSPRSSRPFPDPRVTRRASLRAPSRTRLSWTSRTTGPRRVPPPRDRPS